MKSDDLTQLKHIGASRMKVLNDHGIYTIEDLQKISVEDLAAIKTVGLHNAQLIKTALQEYNPGTEKERAKAAEGTSRTVAKQRDETPVAAAVQATAETRADSSDEPRVEDPAEESHRHASPIVKLIENIECVNDTLKAAWKKKWGDYEVFETKVQDLKTTIGKIDEMQKVLLQKAEGLTGVWNSLNEKPKKKKMRSISKEIDELTRKFKEIWS